MCAYCLLPRHCGILDTARTLWVSTGCNRDNFTIVINIKTVLVRLLLREILLVGVQEMSVF
jgi:hypothetical protein